VVVGDVVLSVSVSVSDSRLASATWSYRWWLDGFGLVDLSGSGVNFADLGVWCVLSQNVSVGMSSMQRFPGLQTQRIPRSGLRTSEPLRQRPEQLPGLGPVIAIWRLLRIVLFVNASYCSICQCFVLFYLSMLRIVLLSVRIRDESFVREGV
jgi:hypothetical protein